MLSAAPDHHRKRRTVDYPLATRLLAEFLGTAILLILGNGSVAAVSLKGSKEFHAGWIVIVIGYACGVMFPCLMFGGISGSHINPAFSTNDAANNKFNYFVNEFVGTLVLVLCALCSLSLPWGKANLAAGAITVGLVCGALVAALGGPTGPALNPARDLMPRLLHQILPLPHKGSSHWTESWIPVVAPICGAIVGVALFKLFI